MCEVCVCACTNRSLSFCNALATFESTSWLFSFCVAYMYMCTPERYFLLRSVAKGSYIPWQYAMVLTITPTADANDPRWNFQASNSKCMYIFLHSYMHLRFASRRMYQRFDVQMRNPIEFFWDVQNLRDHSMLHSIANLESAQQTVHFKRILSIFLLFEKYQNFQMAKK